MTRHNQWISLIGAILALAVVSKAMAHPGGITTPDPDLPPEGVYLSPSDVHAIYSAPAPTLPGALALAGLICRSKHGLSDSLNT
jgi:hypothetical protein